MLQILEALIEIHRRGLLHLDIKPANILVNSKGQICLADLGLMSPAIPPLSTNVITRWYRPPEILLGSTNYGSAVDMWSVGCIFYEMLMGSSPFQGKDDDHQLELILGLCGSDAFKAEGLSRLPRYQDTIRKMARSSSKLEKKLSSFNIPSEAIDLLSRLLSVDPAKRISAEEAFEHDFFYTGVEPEREGDLALPSSSIHEYELHEIRRRESTLHPNGELVETH